MNRTEHPSEEMLADLAAGRLVGAGSEAVIDHLSECDACLALADRLWDDHLIEMAGADIADLDAAAAQQVERVLRGRVRRSDFGGDLVRLSARLLLSVLLALLAPLSSGARSGAPERGRR